MRRTTTSHFDCADNGYTVHAVVQPNGHFVTVQMKATLGNVTAKLTPKQARRVADALRVAAREAEDNGRPVDPLDGDAA